jgi:cytochrome c-type biogenesis protein
MGTEVSYLAAAGAGAFSFLSPCVLPLVPAYLSFMAGTSLEDLKAEDGVDPALERRVVLAAVAFVLGFTTVFVALGASASMLHALVYQYLGILSRVAGVVIVLFGLHYLGVFRRLGWLQFLQRDARYHGHERPTHWAGAFAIGLAFAFGWTPCIGPILATILTLAASQDSLSFGVSLLAVYSLGLGAPFLAAALALPTFLRFSRRFRRHLRTVERTAGAILVATGAMMLFNVWSALGFYLLEAFPALGRIG